MKPGDEAASHISAGAGLVASFGPLFVALVLLSFATWIIDPRGEFPLNDDWDFAAVTWNLARTGTFETTAYTAVALRTQAYIGAGWTLIAGESLTALRILTLLVFAIGIAVLDRILSMLRVPPLSRLVALVAALANPVALATAFSYMTHAYATTILLVSTAFVVKGWLSQKFSLALAGVVLSLTAVLVRQNSVFFLAAVLLFALFSGKSDHIRRRQLVRAVLVGAILFCLLFLLTDWVRPSTGAFAEHVGNASVSLELWQRLARVTTAVPQLTAMFYLPLIPVFVVVAFERRGPQRWLTIATIAIFLVFASRIGALYGFAGVIPRWALLLWPDQLFGTYLLDFGIGVPTVADAQLGLGYVFPAGELVRWVVSLFAAIGGTILTLAFVRCWRNTQDLARLMLLIFAAGLAFLALGSYFFDRYTLEFTWAALVLGALALRGRPALVWPSLTLALLLFGCSTFAVAEYLSWNRARAVLVERDLERGTAAARLNAGVEWNSWLAIGEDLDLDATRPSPGFERLIAFRVLPDYRVIDKEPFSSPAGIRNGVMYLLQKKAERR